MLTVQPQTRDGATGVSQQCSDSGGIAAGNVEHQASKCGSVKLQNGCMSAAGCRSRRISVKSSQKDLIKKTLINGNNNPQYDMRALQQSQ